MVDIRYDQIFNLGRIQDSNLQQQITQILGDICSAPEGQVIYQGVLNSLNVLNASSYSFTDFSGGPGTATFISYNSMQAWRYNGTPIGAAPTINIDMNQLQSTRFSSIDPLTGMQTYQPPSLEAAIVQESQGSVADVVGN